jgi:hypothetical protein
MANRNLELVSGFAPPSFTVTEITLAILEKTCPLFWSVIFF